MAEAQNDVKTDIGGPHAGPCQPCSYCAAALDYGRRATTVERVLDSATAGGAIVGLASGAAWCLTTNESKSKALGVAAVSAACAAAGSQLLSILAGALYRSRRISL
jgi:hypothetical protein